MELSERIRKTSITNFRLNIEPIADEVAQLEAEMTDYLKICQNYVVDLEALQAENAVLIKRLWDYEHQASDERIRDEK